MGASRVNECLLDVGVFPSDLQRVSPRLVAFVEFYGSEGAFNHSHPLSGHKCCLYLFTTRRH